MNSLNILSSRVIGHSRPQTPRSRSSSEGLKRSEEILTPPKRAASSHSLVLPASSEDTKSWFVSKEEAAPNGGNNDTASEKTALLTKSERATSFSGEPAKPKTRLHILVRRLAQALTESVKWCYSWATAPGVYIVACFFTEDGHFSTLLPIKRLRRKGNPKKIGSKSTTNAVGLSGSSQSKGEGEMSEKRSLRSSKPRTTSPPTSGSEGDREVRFAKVRDPGPASSSSDEGGPARRSIRIKQNEETTRQRKQKRKQESAEEAAAAELKSPTSPLSSLILTRYPHFPTPPRPLIPRRQPSFSASSPPSYTKPSQKTLVLDLDETLIHSMAKGGRMSTGHMVEVKLSHPGAYNGLHVAPQHPILYYVHKRPYCDDFLRRVSRWYNLVIFTASVQEYADPVIDWLEQERKYFSARYYRQHCTFRTGAYIKDLSSIEPDLSKVMILDNSPLSYIFHEDNAIPIEGWINDPTDNDLLHLVPLLEGLQHVTDVRALLALRRGEAEAAQ